MVCQLIRNLEELTSPGSILALTGDKPALGQLAYRGFYLNPRSAALRQAFLDLSDLGLRLRA